jgi:hypothetical protein
VKLSRAYSRRAVKLMEPLRLRVSVSSREKVRLLLRVLVFLYWSSPME